MFRPGRTVSVALLAVLALTACETTSGKQAAPAPPSAPPASAAPSPSAAPSGPSRVDVCTKVSTTLADGSVEIADNAVTSIDERWSSKKVDAELRKSFGAMGRKLTAQAAGITDPELKASVEKTAAELGRGARSAKPSAFLQKEYQELGKYMDKVCA